MDFTDFVNKADCRVFPIVKEIPLEGFDARECSECDGKFVGLAQRWVR